MCDDFNPIQLHNSKAFRLRFEMLLSHYDSMPECYEAVEDEFFGVFGHCRYASYDSFRKCREKVLHRKKKKKDMVSLP